jgi:hypothetical protein
MKEDDDGVLFSSREKKNVKKGRNLPLFFHFYIWDEAFFLPSRSSPLSFNVEVSTFLKPCVARLFEVLCYSDLGAFLSFGNGVNGK